MKDRLNMNRFLKVTDMCHLMVAQYLQTGQIAVDATAGNGQDTLFLAQKVGPTGRVYSFDIQKQALVKTREILQANDCLPRVELIHDSHEKLAHYIQEPINCLLYNLGYLPGGNKAVTTTAQTTELSIRQGIQLLAPGGIIAVVIYTEHRGGREESKRVLDILASLPLPQWRVFSWQRENGPPQAPYLLVAYNEGTKVLDSCSTGSMPADKEEWA